MDTTTCVLGNHPLPPQGSRLVVPAGYSCPPCYNEYYRTLYPPLTSRVPVAPVPARQLGPAA